MRVLGLDRTGFHRGAAPAFAAWLALSSSSCVTPRSDASAAANAGHLVAQTITLVDEQGKPWLVLGPSHTYGGRGIQLLHDDGGTAIHLGVARVNEGDASAEPGAASTGVEHRLPVFRMDSEEGDSRATLFADEHRACLTLGYGEGVSVSVVTEAHGVEIYMVRDPTADLDATADADAAPTEFQLSVGANKLMLTLPSKNGVRREIDLLELLR